MGRGLDIPRPRIQIASLTLFRSAFDSSLNRRREQCEITKELAVCALHRWENVVDNSM